MINQHENPTFHPPPSLPEKLRFKKGITGEWIYLREKHASNHPLFGVEGWLYYLAFLLGIGPFIEVYELSREVSLLSVSSTIIVIFAFVFYWFPLYLLRIRRDGFQFWVVFIQGLSSVIIAASLLDKAEALKTETFLMLGHSTLIISYVLFSKRVNVTLKHRVRRDDLHLVMSRKKVESAVFEPFIGKEPVGSES